MRYVIAKDKNYLTQMGFLPSKDHALKFASSDEAVTHMESNKRLCDGASVKVVDDPDNAPRRATHADTEYDPWGLGSRV